MECRLTLSRRSGHSPSHKVERAVSWQRQNADMQAQQAVPPCCEVPQCTQQAASRPCNSFKWCPTAAQLTEAASFCWLLQEQAAGAGAQLLLSSQCRCGVPRSAGHGKRAGQSWHPPSPWKSSCTLGSSSVTGTSAVASSSRGRSGGISTCTRVQTLCKQVQA